MSKKKHKKSSQLWLSEHFNDHYVKEAQAKGYRSRSAFKLIELLEKDRFIEKGDVVVDLGAAPGGWSQIAKKWTGNRGKVFALDLLAMDAIAGVDFIQGDFTEDEVLAKLSAMIGDHQVDVVISDMAPNISGLRSVDQPRAMLLAELALDFCVEALKPGGTFVTKIFQGEGFDQYLNDLRASFDKVLLRKPKASRPRSREIYLVAKSYHPG